jgi:hypothetical protein
MDDGSQKKINAFIRNHNKTDLVKMCKEKNLDCNGTKYDMVIRILNIEKKEIPIASNESPLILRIKKNTFNNYTHDESSMVFDQHTKRVIGVQLPNGNVRPLQRNDIEICQKYKFQFDLPTSLDPSPIFEILENSDDENKNDTDILSDHDELDDDYNDQDDLSDKDDN